VEQGSVGRDSASERRAAERLFHRDLPGGGYVSIELTPVSQSAARIARVIVERRRDRSRRAGHKPPIILEEEWTPERGFGELYRFACDNVAIARGLLRLPRAD
jgi:hypothetical protein